MENRNLFLGLLLGLFVFISCGKKEEAGSSALISGSESKVWKASKETNSQGDKEKLTKDEKKQELQFYSNGTFTVKDEAQHQEGKWNYDQSNKTLSLQFEDEQKTENFKVVELEEDEMKLQAPDGSEMKLEKE